MEKKNAQNLGNILLEYLESNPIFKKNLAENRAIIAWEKLFGENINKFTTNIYLKNQKLYVKISSSVFKQELIQSKDNLIKKINEYAEMEIIKDIIFK